MKSLLVLLLLAASPGLACPTSADLKTGIVVEDDEEFKALYQIRDGQIQRTDFFDTEESWRSTLAFGTFWTKEEMLRGGIHQSDDDMTVTLVDKSAAFSRPSAHLTQTVETQLSFAAESPITETVTHTWAGVGSLSIGDCTFKSISGRIAYQSKGDTYLEIVEFLPALGITLIVGDSISGEKPILYPARKIYVLRDE